MPQGLIDWVEGRSYFFFFGATFLAGAAGAAFSSAALAGLSGVDFSCFTTASKSFWVFQP